MTYDRLWIPLGTLTTLALLLGAAALPGCGGGKLNSKQGSVRLVNATSEFATLDLVSGSTGVAASVASYSASGYAELDPGSLNFALRSPASGANAATTTATVVKEGHTAMLAYTSAGVLNLTPLGEDESAPTAGTARLRFLNTASVEAGAVDVYVLPMTRSSVANSLVALTNLTEPCLLLSLPPPQPGSAAAPSSKAKVVSVPSGIHSRS